MAGDKGYAVPFRVELGFQSGFQLVASSPAEAEFAVQVALSRLRLATENEDGSFTVLEGDMAVTDVEVGDPEQIDIEAIVAAARQTARGGAG